MKGLKNMMEDNVEHELNRLLPTMPQFCSCDDCKLDMATYALNRLKPKYTRSSTGAILHRFDTSSTQVETEILAVVVSAIETIGSHPHHASKDAAPAPENNEAPPVDATAPDPDNATATQTPTNTAAAQSPAPDNATAAQTPTNTATANATAPNNSVAAQVPVSNT